MLKIKWDFQTIFGKNSPNMLWENYYAKGQTMMRREKFRDIILNTSASNWVLLYVYSGLELPI